MVSLLSQAVDSVVPQSSGYHADRQHNQDGKDGVANPFGTALVGINIDVRHVSAPHLEMQGGQGP